MSEKKRIAIIGAGPAAYTAAKDLINAGMEVEIFDKNDQLGGAIYTGIPTWRIPAAFRERVKNELDGLNCVFHFNTTVGKDITLDELLEQFDRVLVAVGAQVENTFGLSAADGFEAGLTLLHELNVDGLEDKYKKYHKALVWGGGNVAMDCCRSLRRRIDDVAIIYRRSEEEMPASKKEIADAEKEGVVFRYLTNIKSLVTDENGKVTGAVLADMELGEPDESGRRRPIEKAGSEHTEECDLVVAAIGQSVNLDAVKKGLEKTEDHKTNIDRVYIAGDARFGPKMIGTAVKDGKEAAAEIIASFEA